MFSKGMFNQYAGDKTASNNGERTSSSNSTTDKTSDRFDFVYSAPITISNLPKFGFIPPAATTGEASFQLPSTDSSLEAPHQNRFQVERQLSPQKDGQPDSLIRARGQTKIKKKKKKRYSDKKHKDKVEVEVTQHPYNEKVRLT